MKNPLTPTATAAKQVAAEVPKTQPPAGAVGGAPWSRARCLPPEPVYTPEEEKRFASEAEDRWMRSRGY